MSIVLPSDREAVLRHFRNVNAASAIQQLRRLAIDLDEQPQGDWERKQNIEKLESIAGIASGLLGRSDEQPRERGFADIVLGAEESPKRLQETITIEWGFTPTIAYCQKLLAFVEALINEPRE